jgi:hypothetical protein
MRPFKDAGRVVQWHCVRGRRECLGGGSFSLGQGASPVVNLDG